MGAYESIIRPLVFLLEPEKAQALAEWGLRRRWLWRALSWHYDVLDPRLQVTVANMELPSPVGLAAGYDKHCEALDSLLRLGFGYVVGGTVLPAPRPGNLRPRVLRLRKTEALINALGFPSRGTAEAAASIRRMGDSGAITKPLWVSISGLSVDEFLECHAALEPLADAMELNISSPNTQGLRVFQEPSNLRELLEALNKARNKPLFVKIPPYTDDGTRDISLALAHVAGEQGMDGVTVANTQPVEAPALAMERGGLSGRPLLEDTLRTVAEVRSEIGGRMMINACGGIATAEDALRALQAGANTVQLLTALVYHGPSVARRINRGLARMMDEQGVDSLEALVAGSRGEKRAM